MSDLIETIQFQEFGKCFDLLFRSEKRKMSPTLEEEAGSPEAKRMKEDALLIKDGMSVNVNLDLLNVKTEPTETLNIFLPNNLQPTPDGSMPVGLTQIRGTRGFVPGGQSVTSKGEKKYSNDMSDCCTHRCRICMKVVTVTGMRNHSRTSHGIPINTYSARFGNYRDNMERVTWHR